MSKSANQPKRHHYVPEFLLARWARADGRVRTFRRREDGLLFEAWCLTKEVGVQNHLWSKGNPADADRGFYETMFFSPIDSEAAEVMHLMEQEAAKVRTPEFRPFMIGEFQKGIWSIFVASILGRQPAAIARAKADIPRMAQEYAAKFDSGDPDFIERPGMQRFVEWAEKLKPGKNSARRIYEEVLATAPWTFDDIALDYVRKAIMGGEVTKAIGKMTWLTRILVPPVHSLIMSDRPITQIRSLADPNCVLAFPLSPQSAFIASQDEAYLDYLMRLSDKEFAAELNLNTVSRARSFVVGSCQHRFLERHFLVRKSDESVNQTR